MPELTDFPSKTRHFNIATEIGAKFHAVGTGLLNDERGTVVPAIVLENRGNAEQINMDILRRWVQGKGIADHTWRGLLGVLRVHCLGLAQDIEETLRAEHTTIYNVQCLNLTSQWLVCIGYMHALTLWSCSQLQVHEREAAVAPETDSPQAASAEAEPSHIPSTTTGRTPSLQWTTQS